jgi:Fic family protein
MKSLMSELKRPHYSPIVASCAFHYELEFLHPFSDGNGRLGRFWHTVLLRQVHPIFDQLSIESVLDRERDGYYRALSASDKAGHALPFVEFMLDILADSLRNLLHQRPSPPQTSEARIQYFAEFGPQHFTRTDYLAFYPSLSAPTASRDLRTGTASAHWVRYGDKRTTTYVIPRANETVNAEAPTARHRRQPASNPIRLRSSD